MNLDTASCYQALLTHDARFDGASHGGLQERERVGLVRAGPVKRMLGTRIRLG
jgi:hypothetical protein